MHEHEDYGGLQRDLRATGQAIDRRGLFRLASRLGAGVMMTVLGTDGGAVGVALATSAPSSTVSMNIPP